MNHLNPNGNIITRSSPGDIRKHILTSSTSAPASINFLHDPNIRLLLFGGKGGVGKTTCAAAAAITLAEQHRLNKYLLVSTDPAHSILDSFANTIPPSNLSVIELNSQNCLLAFKKKHSQKFLEIARRGSFLDDEDINKLLEHSLPGLDELMALLEISDWLKNNTYKCIIVDTAPTGHTLRLLSIPELARSWIKALDVLVAKHRYMIKVFRGKYQPDAIDSFLDDLLASVNRFDLLLIDKSLCRFIPVMIAEELSINETVKLVQELKCMNVRTLDIVVNRLFMTHNCSSCDNWYAQQLLLLQEKMYSNTLLKSNFWGIPLHTHEIRGLNNLKSFWQTAFSITQKFLQQDVRVKKIPYTQIAVEFPANYLADNKRFIIFAGKGGVGKTTAACAYALRLSHNFPERKILLFSSDPAHSLSDCLEKTIGPKPVPIINHLYAMEIDAQAEFKKEKESYLEELNKFLHPSSSNIDIVFDQEVIKRIFDITPPGLDEIMALSSIMDFYHKNTYDTLILDSAATGHLIRLLELPEIISFWLKAYFSISLKYQDVFWFSSMSQKFVRISKNLKMLRKLLSNHEETVLYIVSILTEMALDETKDLMAYCRRTNIYVPAIFLNLVTPTADNCPLGKALKQQENKVKARFHQFFPDIDQIIIYRSDKLTGLQQISEPGDRTFHLPVQELLITAQT